MTEKKKIGVSAEKAYGRHVVGGKSGIRTINACAFGYCFQVFICVRFTCARVCVRLLCSPARNINVPSLSTFIYSIVQIEYSICLYIFFSLFLS